MLIVHACKIVKPLFIHSLRCCSQNIPIGDWVATDFGTNVFYIGKVTRVNPGTETADAMFLKKHVGDKYKESTAKDKGIESFTFDQVITTDVDVDYLKGGLFQLKNFKEIENQRIAFRKNKRQRNK